MSDYLDLTQSLENDPRWIQNSTWLALFSPNDSSLLESWQTVVNDLKTHDIHPPVYFLWLNLILQSTETLSPALGWISNIPFYLLNSVLIYVIGMRFFQSSRVALLGLFIWVISAATIKTALVARHYEIFTSLILFFTLIIATSYRNNRLTNVQIATLGVLTYVTYLTNYQLLFSLPAIGICIAYLHRHSPLKVMICGATMLLSLAAAIATYPALFQQSQEVQSWQAPLNSFEPFLFRIRNSLEEIVKFSVFGSIVFIFSLFFAKPKQEHPHSLTILLVLTILVNLGVYLSFLTPKHAMGERYLAAAWPLLALFLAGYITRYWDKNVFRYIALILIIVPSIKYLTKDSKHHPPPTELAGSALVVADFNKRGIWPAFALALNPDQATLVAPQQALITNNDWDGQLHDADTVFLISSSEIGENTKQGQKKLKERLNDIGHSEKLKIPNSALNVIKFKIHLRD